MPPSIAVQDFLRPPREAVTLPKTEIASQPPFFRGEKVGFRDCVINYTKS